MVNIYQGVKIIFTVASIESIDASEEKVKSLDEVKEAEVEITFDPPWTQELMSEEAKLELGML